MSNLVTIYGGSGFIGRYIARRMAKEGWRVRVAVRRPNEAMFVKPYGSVGQVELVLCNIRDDASVAAAMQGADAVVNCVGTFDAGGKNNFEAVQIYGAERIAKLASEAGIARMVHISALGADLAALSDSARTKALGEAAVHKYMPDAMILRPSVVFGPEDQFFNRFASMSRLGPILPVIGGKTRFQPVYVDDVAAAAVKGVLGDASGTYELGGPEVRTFRELLQTMLEVIQRRKLIMNIPFPIARVLAAVFDVVEKISLGIVKNPSASPDQVKALRVDNVVHEGAKGLDDLGITPVALEAVLPDYLWRFRPSGQYAALKDSAKNLRA